MHWDIGKRDDVYHTQKLGVSKRKGTGKCGNFDKPNSHLHLFTLFYTGETTTRLQKNVKIGPKFPKKSITFKYSAEK